MTLWLQVPLVMAGVIAVTLASDWLFSWLSGETFWAGRKRRRP